MKELKILYINYINKKLNKGEILHLDFIDTNFEYKNIIEMKDTFEDEPIMLMYYVIEYSYLCNTIIINLNNLDKNMEEFIINKISAVIEYLKEDLEIKVPKIIYINNKLIIKNFVSDIKS